MLIIDRYMLRQFLQTLAICFCSLTGLFIVIDGFGNLEEFISYGKDHGGLLSVMAPYYAYRTLSFFDRTSGILTLIAAMFTATWIQRHQELTALEAAGLSRRRIVKPVVLAVAAVSLAAMLNRELVIPNIRQHLAHNAQDLGGATAKPLVPRYDNQTDILFRGQEIYSAEQRIRKPSFLLPKTLNEHGNQLTAEEAVYLPPSGQRPGGYLLSGVETPAGLDDEASLLLDGRPIIVTPRDAGWLKPGQCFVASGVSFEQLEGGYAWRQYSSTFELIRGLRNRSLDFGADVRVTIHSRMVQPLLDMVLLFLGLPLVLSRSNRNMFLAIGLCAAVVVVFSGIVLGCQYLGSSLWISPALAAWLPLMVCVPWAVSLAQPLWE